MTAARAPWVSRGVSDMISDLRERIASTIEFDPLVLNAAQSVRGDFQVLLDALAKTERARC